MLLQTVRPNIVQSIRAYGVDALMRAAQEAGHHFLYADLSQAQNKAEVLEGIATSFTFPATLGKSLDTLYDGMTDLVHRAGVQPGFVVVIEQLPGGARFDRELREQLLDVFRDAADFWAERRVAFRCFYSFAVSRAHEVSAWERAAEAAPTSTAKPAAKLSSSKNGLNPNFGTNMPMMSSAFDTSMWLNAA